ncbi:MAG: hypothetical protein RJB38_2161, partial [Pseudomonadota bacterium]
PAFHVKEAILDPGSTPIRCQAAVDEVLGFYMISLMRGPSRVARHQ